MKMGLFFSKIPNILLKNKKIKNIKKSYIIIHTYRHFGGCGFLYVSANAIISPKH